MYMKEENLLEVLATKVQRFQQNRAYYCMINKFNLPGPVKNASSATGPFE